MRYPPECDGIHDAIPTGRMRAWVLCLLLILVAPGCDIFGEDDDDNIVGGVDLDELFAPPGQGETDAVESEWSARIPQAQDAHVVYEDSMAIGEWTARVNVVSHFVGDTEHFGALVLPESDFDRPRPVLIYLHGGDNGISIDNEIGTVMQYVPELRDEFIFVIPSFRSESLRIRDLTFESDGPPSPWNYDVDDALALLEVALEMVPQADPERIAALGFSRGAAVAMLMGIRDPRIDGVVEFFGPTDFFGAFVRGVVRDMLRDRARSLPGTDFLDETVIQPLRNGELAIPEARIELLRRSPVHFADRLPALQVHHWTADSVVPVSEAGALINAMDAIGAEDFEPYIYQGGPDHSITFESLEHTLAFLLRIANGQEPPA
jgi:dipeptidyl aminopeptidase/acylaminoacyl peptidase